MIKTFENFTALKKESDYYRKGPVKISETDIKFREICDNITRKEFSEEDAEYLNSIAEYPNFYNVVHDWLSNEFRIFKKYSLEDMQDRLLEYSDNLLKWKLSSMLSLSRKNSSNGISEYKLNDDNYFYQELKSTIKDIAYACTSSKEMTIDQYLHDTRASVYFSFDGKADKSYDTYNFEYVESMMLEFERRMKNMYNMSINHGDSSPEVREKRRYNTNIDVSDYSFVMNLPRR